MGCRDTVFDICSSYMRELNMPSAFCLKGLTEGNTMVSKLPLLFAGGYLTCLDEMTVEQLEKFVPFLMKCSSGYDSSIKPSIPNWWPTDVEFSFPLVKPQVVESKWLCMLKSLVYRCYSYYGCGFMLQLCTELCQYPASHLPCVDTSNGIISLYNKETGRIVVTFRKEHMFYDRNEEMSKETSPKADVKHDGVQSSDMEVYLCEYCDDEFYSLCDIQEHEEKCNNKPKQIPPPVFVEDQNGDEQVFFQALCLVNNNDLKYKDALENTYSHVEHIGNPTRYFTVPVSSPLGNVLNKMLASQPTSPSILQEKIETYCCGKPDPNSSSMETVWPVTWKPRRKSDSRNSWCHVYKFPKYWHCEVSINKQGKILAGQCLKEGMKGKRVTRKAIKHSILMGNAHETTINANQNGMYKKNNFRKVLPCLKVAHPVSVENSGNNNVKTENKCDLSGISTNCTSGLQLSHDSMENKQFPTAYRRLVKDVLCSSQIVERTHKPQEILVIDLCSSDEENNQ